MPVFFLCVSLKYTHILSHKGGKVSLWKQGGKISKSYLLRHELKQQKGVYGESGNKAVGVITSAPYPPLQQSFTPLNDAFGRLCSYVHFYQPCSILILLDLRAPRMHNRVRTLGVCVGGGGGGGLLVVVWRCVWGWGVGGCNMHLTFL